MTPAQRTEGASLKWNNLFQITESQPLVAGSFAVDPLIAWKRVMLGSGQNQWVDMGMSRHVTRFGPDGGPLGGGQVDTSLTGRVQVSEIGRTI